MIRRSLVLGLVLIAGTALPVAAQDIVASIIGQLQSQGFGAVEAHRTLLGRTRIVATSADGQREIIVNPNTGEILRDFWQPLDGSPSAHVLVENPTGSQSDAGDGEGRSGSGSGGDGGSDGEGGDDHGGSSGGSGSSGSGSGGSSGGGGEGSGGDGHGGSSSGSGSGSGGSDDHSGPDGDDG